MNVTRAHKIETAKPTMKKIGKTSSGTIIVEMSTETFHALSQLQATPPPAENPQSQTAKTANPENLAFVKKRILKSKPKTKAGLTRFIAAMFQFKGGIPEQEIQTTIKNLQKEKTLAIDENNQVTYKKA